MSLPELFSFLPDRFLYSRGETPTVARKTFEK